MEVFFSKGGTLTEGQFKEALAEVRNGLFSVLTFSDTRSERPFSKANGTAVSEDGHKRNQQD
jgi:hypothetical protein